MHDRKGSVHPQTCPVGESDDTVEGDPLVGLEEFPDGGYMTSVLPQGITEMILLPVELLCPVLTVLPTVDLPLVVLCLDDEHPVSRHDHVVYLGAVSAALEEKVVDDEVLILRKPRKKDPHHLLTALPLGYLEDDDKREEADDKNDSKETGIHRLS